MNKCKIAILDALTLGECDLDAIRSFGELQIYNTTKPSERLLHASEHEIIITNKVLLDRDILSQLPDLRLICISATGMNNVDLEYATERGISVKNVAGYSTSSVAQHTLTLALSMLGNLAYYSHYTASGAWQKSEVFTHLERDLVELDRKRWGIIGMGAIGQRTAQLASAFGADVCYYSTSGINNIQSYSRIDLDMLLQTCDIISIHAPLNPQTANLIGESELMMISDSAILINVGRGGIIDEEALAKVMHEKPLRVALDVLEHEPIRENHPLLDKTLSPRLIITPHIAWGYKESRKRLIDGIAKNIAEFLEGKK